MKGTLHYRGANFTDHRRTIDFGLWQAGLLRYVGQDPQLSTWEAKVLKLSATPHPQVTQRLSFAARKITEP